MTTLDVKNADNALAASQKWALVYKAVGIVKNKYPQYDLSAWNKILDAQTNINSAKDKKVDTTNMISRQNQRVLISLEDASKAGVR